MADSKGKKKQLKPMYCYSPRHQRRLLAKQTKADLNKIRKKQSTSAETSAIFVDRNIPSSSDSTYSTVCVSCTHTELLSCDRNTITPDVIPDFNLQVHTHNGTKLASEDTDVENSYIYEKYESSSDDNDDELTISTKEDFKQVLCQWAIDYNVRHNCLGQLLGYLRKYTNFDLPKDPRTLLSTPRSTVIANDGTYLHIGVENALKNILEVNPTVSEIRLLINIDGLPISRSSNACLWPILCSDDINTELYLIGCYHGYEKPKNVNVFLEMFVNEAVHFVNTGLLVNEMLVRIKIHGLICDAPAKSFVLSVKGHGGYNSCTKCTIHGDYQNNRVCFPYKENISDPLRTDIDFRNNKYDDYQIGDTILKRIPDFGLVSNVPIDYMHLLCLGVMKKLIILWLSGQPLSIKLPSIAVKNISTVLLDLQSTVPKEFSRKPRSLADVNYWKATEFRNFLLYYGPLALKHVVSDNVYKNFLALHVASRILISHTAIKNPSNLEYAENLLKYFVSTFQIIYGTDKISHNIHNLLHICNDVRKYGHLDLFSSFKFENYMAQLKRFLRKNDKPLPQLARRYYEVSNLYTKTYQLRRQCCPRNAHNDGPLHYYNCQSKVTQYSMYDAGGKYLLNCKDEKNNCFLLTNGEVVLIHNIIESIDTKDIKIIGQILTPCGDLYTTPCASSDIDIQLVTLKDESLHAWDIHDIKQKLWKMVVKNDVVVVPIANTEI